MKERLYIPVDCPSCQKRSVVAMAVAEVGAALEEDSPILLQCAFDDARWAATPTERRRIARLSAEQAQIADSTWLRLAPGHHEYRERYT